MGTTRVFHGAMAVVGASLALHGGVALLGSDQPAIPAFTLLGGLIVSTLSLLTVGNPDRADRTPSRRLTALAVAGAAVAGASLLLLLRPL